MGGVDSIARTLYYAFIYYYYFQIVSLFYLIHFQSEIIKEHTPEILKSEYSGFLGRYWSNDYFLLTVCCYSDCSPGHSKFCSSVLNEEPCYLGNVPNVPLYSGHNWLAIPCKCSVWGSVTQAVESMGPWLGLSTVFQHN